MKKSYISLAVTCLFATTAFAADTLLEEVVTSVNRYEQKAFDTAASVNVINKSQIQDSQPMINISESLVRVPGLNAQFHNYAQDLLLSSRGFGSNSTFGARGIKIYVDGIPATMADGQGQVSHIDLASAEKIEVIRGPFASIYGNSAGGVINVYSQTAKPGTSEVEAYGSYGSFATSRTGVKALGESNGINYLLDANELSTNGYRVNGGANRNNENAKLGFNLGDDSQVTLVANKVSIRAEDPLGVNQGLVNLQSRGMGYNCTNSSCPAVGSNYQTHKDVDQTQGGFEYVKRIDANNYFKAVAYGGDRSQSQQQAPSTSTGASSTLQLSRHYYGLDTQYSSSFNLASLPMRMITGLSYQQNQDHSTTNWGALADANYAASSFDQYLQVEAFLSDKYTLSSGIRHTDVVLTADNNKTGWVHDSWNYGATLPMASLTFNLDQLTNTYISVGKGFDSPTLNQIKYSYGVSGFQTTPNTSLMSSNTTQYELGIKRKLGSSGVVNIAIFDAETINEAVVDINSSGKTAFVNAPNTRRQGLEFFAQSNLMANFGASLSYTYLLAKVTQGYTTDSGSVVNSGNMLPGAPKNNLFADLYWRTSNQSVDYGFETVAVSGMYANDTNSSLTSGYVVFNARAGFKQTYQGWTFSEYLRLNNLTDKYYVSSVIVNQAGSNYFEPAAGRNYMAGVRATYKF